MQFIPVYTGNITPVKKEIRGLAVYPCVYREHKMDNEKEQQITGLSLCIQGTLIVQVEN